jgi:hypothetical protein
LAVNLHPCAFARGGSENISLKNASFGKLAGIKLTSGFSTMQGSSIEIHRARIKA